MAPPAGGPGHLCPRLCPSGTRCPLRGPPLWGQVSSVQSLSCVQPFATPWTAARQESLSITNPRSLPKLMSIESVRPLSHLILCRPLSSHLQSFPASGSFPICASNTGSLCLCPLSPLGHGQPLPAFSPGTRAASASARFLPWDTGSLCLCPLSPLGLQCHHRPCRLSPREARSRWGHSTAGQQVKR